MSAVVIVLALVLLAAIGAAGWLAVTLRRERAAADARLADLLATASHELRSPLTSVKGFVELLENGTRDGTFTEREREFVEIIHRSTDRLAALVDELLDLAQLDADRAELRRTSIDVGEAIADVAELMGPRLATKEQQLGVYVAPTLPLAFADAGRVRQIVSNLLTNAHLYTPAGGRLHIGAEPDRAWVRIVVADSGVGMREEDAARAFERFYRAPGGSADVPGTGLGLAIVRSLVELQRGEVALTSRAGVGTTVEVRLPASRREPDDVATALRGRRILVAAGSTATVAAIEATLTALAARDAEARRVDAPVHAARELSRAPYDALVFDLADGHDDVREAVAAVRTDPELAATPIVFLGAERGSSWLDGEWTVGARGDAETIGDVLAAAVRAGRARVLVIGREELQPALEPALDELGIEYEWECTSAAAARVCAERRFELALLDAGMRGREATLAALARPGRRLRDAVILFSERHDDGAVAIAEAPAAVRAALRGERTGDGPSRRG